MIKPEELFSHFEQLAEQMGIVLVQGRGDFRGGYCQVRDEEFIVLNETKPLESRLRVLAETFRELDITDRTWYRLYESLLRIPPGFPGESLIR